MNHPQLRYTDILTKSERTIWQCQKITHGFNIQAFSVQPILGIFFEQPPIVSDDDTYCKIRAAKKPRSGVPSDLPKLITQEFSPELSTPVSRIINSMFQSGEWPSHWKLEHVIPIGKVPMPESEDDIRPISFNPIFQ